MIKTTDENCSIKEQKSELMNKESLTQIAIISFSEISSEICRCEPKLFADSVVSEIVSRLDYFLEIFTD